MYICGMETDFVSLWIISVQEKIDALPLEMGDSFKVKTVYLSYQNPKLQIRPLNLLVGEDGPFYQVEEDEMIFHRSNLPTS